VSAGGDEMQGHATRRQVLAGVLAQRGVRAGMDAGRTWAAECRKKWRRSGRLPTAGDSEGHFEKFKVPMQGWDNLPVSKACPRLGNGSNARAAFSLCDLEGCRDAIFQVPSRYPPRGCVQPRNQSEL